MSDHASLFSGRRPEVCPLCHGSKGAGGIFGCKCADNTRLLAASVARTREGGAPALAASPGGPAKTDKLIECEVCGAPFVKRTKSTCCGKECQEARLRAYKRGYYLDHSNPSGRYGHGETP